MQLFAMVGRMRLVSDREVIVAAKRVCGELVISAKISNSPHTGFRLNHRTRVSRPTSWSESRFQFSRLKITADSKRP